MMKHMLCALQPKPSAEDREKMTAAVDRYLVAEEAAGRVRITRAAISAVAFAISAWAFVLGQPLLAVDKAAFPLKEVGAKLGAGYVAQGGE